jgi:hypothetical protein
MTEFLYRTVELIEKYDTIPVGATFAVDFKDQGWITFLDKDIRNKFKIINPGEIK